VAPPAAGMKADRLEQVTDWPASQLSDRYFGAQLVVLRGGRVVLDFICGELVWRVTGKKIQEFFDENFARPLGLTRTSFGLPRSAWGERVVIHGRAAFLFNGRRMREAVCPSATTSTTAKEVAVFYEMLCRFIKMPVRWSQAFMLGGVSSDEDLGRIMGRNSSRETVGCGGSSCCVAWCDPGRDNATVKERNAVDI
jgi:CubicO group peptidase (beta-lactamase class C family)